MIGLELWLGLGFGLAISALGDSEPQPWCRQRCGKLLENKSRITDRKNLKINTKCNVMNDRCEIFLWMSVNIK